MLRVFVNPIYHTDECNWLLKMLSSVKNGQGKSLGLKENVLKRENR